MLSEVTKKNANILSILEGAGVMPTVETIGPYYPKLAKEFICNMAEDIDDPVSPNFQKVTFCNFTFDFSPSIINRYFGRENGEETGYNLQLSEIVKVLTGGVVDTWSDKGQIASSKMSVKYVILHKIGVANWVPSTHTASVFETLARAVDTGGAFGSGNVETSRILRYEIMHLDGVI
ncbi:hypothetical protein LIER_25915 [Lithospermum erythrorhizon]|uniref:Putative plant transposon protein domain-containing protein n=1 Tax=Lithospermum erythrorhizon TaxID=34254 RepID=A0AAV3R820_LITER